MSPIKITVGQELATFVPDFVYATIQCNVVNTRYNPLLWEEINDFSHKLAQQLPIDEIKNREAIATTRSAYKLLGKNPNRYRPSSEALCRRVVKGVGLYAISTVVDLINLVSLQSGYAIGGFDVDRIVGQLRLGIGKIGEPFDAIGRGQLNVEGLPIYRDEMGGIGTPTSDAERTKITDKTTHLLMIINAYGAKSQLPQTVKKSIDILEKYASATDVAYYIHW